MSGPRAGPNPYVGPRPFETGEPLFGRDRELRELLYLLSGERIVLLHSPSGAGKSSLIQAGLIPRLRERFDVWRPTRVGHPRPPGVATDVNRYALSAMLGFEQGIPAALRQPAPALAGLRLSEYLAARPRRPGAPEQVVLIFDQFEEVLTADPLAIAAKRAFFAQLGELLQDPLVWALFSLREDYLAPFDPYAQQVPTHLRSRYRLDMLGLDAAREAIARPAAGDPRQWTEPALDRIVRDLAAVKVQQADGSFSEATGLYIEPMQLQVVCRGLWERMPEADLSVDLEDVAAFGDVTHALGTYYAEEVRRIAGQDEAAERALREWVGEKLITSDGIRRPVLRAAGASEGLANDQIGRLVDAHLVRADHRGGATWYELAHDRLVAPLRADNARWAEANLQPVQIQAALWARQGRPAALLLSEEALAEAERWAAARAAPLAEPDLGFLAASRAARGQERALRDAQGRALAAAQDLAEAQTRAAARQRRFTRVVGLLLLLALVAAGFSFWQYREAGRQAERAEENSREAREQSARAEEKSSEAEESAKRAREQAERARNLLAMSGVRELLEREDKAQAAKLLLEVPSAPGWIGQAHAALQDVPELTLRGHLNRVNMAVWSPDGARLATASDDRTARVWRADGKGEPLVLGGHPGPVAFVQWSPDGARVLTQSSKKGRMGHSLRVWTNDEALVLTEDEGLRAVWSPDSTHIVAIGLLGKVLVWSADGTGEPLRLRAHEADERVITIESITAAWSPDGAQILVVCDHGIASVWSREGVLMVRVATGLPSAEVVGFSPDGRRIVYEYEEAYSGGVRKVLMWDLEATRSPWRARRVSSPPMHPEFQWFEQSPQHPPVVTWSTAGGMAWSREGALLSAFKRLSSLSPDGERKLKTSPDGRVFLHATRPELEEPEVFHAESGRWSPDGRRVFAWSRNETSIWTPYEAAATVVLQGSSVQSATWSPSGARILTTSFDGVSIWAAQGSTEPLPRATQPDWQACSDAFAVRRSAQVQWSPDSARALVINERCAELWTADGALEPFILKGDEVIRSASWRADSRRLAVSSDRTTWIWSAEGTGEPELIPGRSAQWSPVGKRLVVVQEDGTARILDGAAEPLILREDSAAIESTSWSPDGQQILVRSRPASSEPALRVWTAAGTDARAVPESAGAEASWSPDGARLLLWFRDQRAPRIWAVDGSEGPQVLAGHQSPIVTAGWSGDGRSIFASCEDGVARLWSVDGTTEPLEIGSGSSELSPDGRHILVSDRQRRVRVWRLDASELREVLQRANHDCLSPANRHAYLDESEAAALETYEACERGHGRVPFFKSAVGDKGLGAHPTQRQRQAEVPADPVDAP